MLDMLEDLQKIHVPDESMVALGADRQWIWYHIGKDNPGASVPLIKFPLTILVFTVIGIGFKSDPLLVDGGIDTDWYFQNFDRLGFTEALDAVHRPFGGTFKQDDAPAHIS
jgi:hypothetical protein